ncbi:PREDICTED: uncharacterized protein LOC109463493 [Branchiostoma belcheri]|uniref:Uncharacterized protein LOC109463493 n=1 Tax=Branchiostoma belcheri TaxID=7741 RepID=A0A6P4YAQ3_BRABE|nr:PREDICTED: uncharacterized protein LOC109463493 [Branchiostoma belcheri]
MNGVDTLKELRVQVKSLQTDTDQARWRADELSRRAEAAEWTAQTAAKLREEAEKEREQAVQERDTLFKILQNYRGQNGVIDLKIKRMAERTCDRTVQTYIRSCMSCIREGNVAAILQGSDRCPHAGNIGVSQANLVGGNAVLQPSRQPSWANNSGASRPATTTTPSGTDTQDRDLVPFESRAVVQARTAERLGWGQDWARVDRPMPQTGNMQDSRTARVIFRRPASASNTGTPARLK